jgi:Flp pilus assembly protein TadG
VEEIIMKKNRKDKNESGQSLAELAISLTVLLILLAGLVDLGRAFFTFVTLRDAAQEGASYASVAEDTPLASGDMSAYCASITNRVLVTTTEMDGGVSSGPIDLQALADAGEVTVLTEINGTECTSVPAADVCLGSAVRVEVEYGSFPMTMPFMGTIIGSQTIPLRADVVDTILTPACQ